MQTIAMNGIKIDNINNVNAVNAPSNQSEIKGEDKNTSKDMLESHETQAQKTQKHVITYIGNSEYTDSTGHKWHKHNEMTYTDDEYNTRYDLHFMVKYGEMKHIVVTM